MKSNDKILFCICLGAVLSGCAISTMYGDEAFLPLVTVLEMVVLLVVAEALREKKLAQEEQRQKEAAEQEERRIQEEEKRRQEERNKPIRFYNDCEKRNIYSSTTEDEKQGIMLIARKHGINDFEEALAVFQQGKDMVMKEEADRQKAAEEAKRKGKIEKLNAERAEEAKTIEKQKQTAMIYGSEKYSCAIKQEMKPWKEKYDTAKQKADEMDRSAESLTVLSSLATSVYSYEKPVQEENWAIHGGIANAIAGPAAGLATAMDVQRRNAEAKAEAALDRQRRAKELASLQSDISSLRSSVYEGSGSVYKDMREAQKCIDNLENQLVELNDKLIDDSDTEKKFELLNFSNFKGSVRETGNIDVTGESTLTQDIFVATVKGWLDGSVKLTVLDKSNTPVAIGYFNVEYSPNVLDRNFKFNENSDTFGMTKNTQRTISALCAPIDGKSVSNTDGLTVMVEPVYMWIIED